MSTIESCGFDNKTDLSLICVYPLQILHISSGRYSVGFGCGTYVGIESNLFDTVRSSVCENHRSSHRCDYRQILRLLLLGMANSWALGKFDQQFGVIERSTWWRQWRQSHVQRSCFVPMRCQFLCCCFGRKCQLGTSTRFGNLWNLHHLLGLYSWRRFDYCFLVGSIVTVISRNLEGFQHFYVVLICYNHFSLGYRYGEKRKGSESAKELSGVALLSATLNQCKKPNQQLLVPITVWIGMEQAFIGADFTQVNSLHSLRLLTEINHP